MMRLRDEQVRALLNASRETRDVEIDCDDFLSLMAEYAEVRAEVARSRKASRRRALTRGSARVAAKSSRRSSRS